MLEKKYLTALQGKFLQFCQSCFSRKLANENQIQANFIHTTQYRKTQIVLNGLHNMHNMQNPFSLWGIQTKCEVNYSASRLHTSSMKRRKSVCIRSRNDANFVENIKLKQDFGAKLCHESLLVLPFTLMS